jgi:ABC-type transport system involved in multi-copper enzyme maturation permease subunit
VKNVRILAAITFLEGARNRIFYGLLTVSLLLIGANLVITHSFSYDLGKVAVDIGLSATAIFGLIIIFFLGINLISKDLDKLTVYMVLGRPIARWQYVLGKFIGLSLIILVSMLILGAISASSVIIATLGKARHVPVNFSWSGFAIALLYQYLSLNLITAFTLLFAVLTTSSFMAMILSLATYFIGQNVELLIKLLISTEFFEQAGKILTAAQALSWIFPNLAAFDLKTAAAYGLPLDPAYLAWTLVYGLAYTGALLVLTSLIFNRRELA